MTKLEYFYLYNLKENGENAIYISGSVWELKSNGQLAFIYPVFINQFESTPHPVIILTSFQLSQTYIRQINRFIHREKKRIIIAVLASFS